MFRSYRFILLAVLLALLAAVVPATSSASTTPAPLVIEGPTLSGVLQDAAVHIEACRCQQNVSRFHFERTFILTIRLTIYMGNGDVGTASAPTPESRFAFEGPSLPDLFRNAAGTLDRCGCANEVFDVTYERTPGGMHRLILHLHRVSPDVVLGVAQDNSLSSTDILPIVVEGPALSRVLSDAAERLVQCGCQGSVVNMFYERVPN